MLEILPPSAKIVDLKEGVTLDFDEIAAAVGTRAAEFAGLGVAAGDRAVIGHGQAAAFLVDLFALWQLGGTAICLPASLTEAERDLVAASTGPGIWIGEAAGGGVPLVRPGLPRPDAAPPRSPATLALDAPALILMTSGTTSRPKGVVHSHRSLRARLALNIAHIGAADLVRSLTLLPMHFGHGLIGNSLTPLAAGGTLFASPDPGVDGLARLGALIDAHAITFMSSVPAMWRVALKLSPRPSGGSLRRIHVGSAPLSAELWRSVIDWAAIGRVVNTYGITETANWIGGADAAELEPEDGLVGRTWGGALAVRGEDGQLRPFGRGEIAVASPSVMTGYLDRPDLTAAALAGGWFFTGDTGEIDADGRLRLVGRRKNEINCAGIKVPAEEIDLLLERHPSIREACAFGLDDPVSGEVVAAAIVTEAGHDLDLRELRQWCQTRIRREAVPARFFALAAIPRTDRGKINRDAVRAAALLPG
jgi:acyl-CoA synthetase (AMP-forming)/AMP-acid ligase II